MKPKIKKFINSKLFIFIITALVFSTIGVSAATYFASSQVTYDNKTSGLNATNVQGAIDELYNTCFPPKSSSESIIEENNLGQDPYECRYFFIGANPNNYITFNGESAGWRIISVECDGTIKIIRTLASTSIQWDTQSSNDWDRPAAANTYLNGTYHYSLTTTAKNQIVFKDFSIGKYNIGGDLLEQVTQENSKIWNGKIALPTLSEYIRTNSNSECRTFSATVNSYYDDNTCKKNSWMFSGSSSWTLTAYGKLASTNVFYVSSSGRINVDGYSANSDNYGVRPVVYLSSSVQITGGDGSQSNPYTIK